MHPLMNRFHDDEQRRLMELLGVKETIAALEQAKQELRQAFGDVVAPEAVAVEKVAIVETSVAAVLPALEPAVEEPEVEEPVVEVPVVEEPVIEEPAAEATPEAEEEEAADEGHLYVVEERSIRNRPARILSDGTVEAETDEGWMRFENLEHLDEYLEAISPASRA